MQRRRSSPARSLPTKAKVNSWRKRIEGEGLALDVSPVTDPPVPEQRPWSVVTELLAPYGLQDPSELLGQRPSLGALLVQAALATDEQVQDAIAEGMRSGEKLGEVIVRKGWASEERMAELLAEQWQLRYLEAAAAHIDPVAMARVPFEAVRELELVPIGLDEHGVVLATANPSQMTFAAVRLRIGEASYAVITRTALDELLKSPEFSAPAVEPEPPPLEADELEPGELDPGAVEPVALAAEGEPEGEPEIDAEPEPARERITAEESASQAGDEPGPQGESEHDPGLPEEAHSWEVELASARASGSRAEAAVTSIAAATDELRSIHAEVEELAGSLEQAVAQLAERDARLREAHTTAERDEETIRRLEAELSMRGERFEALKKQVARLTETLEVDGSS
jgi:hypothetical protein